MNQIRMKNLSQEPPTNQGLRFLSYSGTSTPVLPLSNWERRRKAMSSIHTLDLAILTHQKLVQFNQQYGDKEKIPELLKFMEVTTAGKERLVSELRTTPPCLESNCLGHTVLRPLDSIIDSSKAKSKKPPQKRKNKKEDSEGFVFSKKTARPTTPTNVLQPTQTQND
ncbi:hypothetical protein TNCV_3888711 [Trichonephila clavipes]|nr:hypothetical protein TNCV_3888711 [Trichonephila clavipes]